MSITTLAAARFRVLEEVGWPAEKDQKNAALRDRRVRADVREIQASGVTVAIGKFPIEVLPPRNRPSRGSLSITTRTKAR